jgi:large subunit ribosomal protein L20
MPRVRKGAARAQARKRVLKRARGYFGSRANHKWLARLAIIQAGWYSYRDRRNRKRDMRALWITRLTAACQMRGTRYSVFINGLKLAGIKLNRKMLSEVAINDPKAFDAILKLAQNAQAAHKPAHAKAPAKAH